MKNKIELKRNEKTGIVESWKNGKKIGEIITIGDLVQNEKKEKNYGRRNTG